MFVVNVCVLSLGDHEVSVKISALFLLSSVKLHKGRFFPKSPMSSLHAHLKRLIFTYLSYADALFLTPPWTKVSNILELEIDLNSS